MIEELTSFHVSGQPTTHDQNQESYTDILVKIKNILTLSQNPKTHVQLFSPLQIYYQTATFG